MKDDRNAVSENESTGCGLTVVGIGAGGWNTVDPAGRDAVESAEVVLGGERHLAMLPEVIEAVREPWPSPLLDGLDPLLDRHRGRRIVALASGDPLVSGIGATLIRRLGSERVRVIPAVSSAALARARMGWSAEESAVVTLVGRGPDRSVDRLRRHLAPGRRLIVLTGDEHGLGAVSRILVEEGFGESEVTLLAELGGPDEHGRAGRATEFVGGEGEPLSLLCIECRGGPGWSLGPGLPDDAYEHDGQLSRRAIRALAVSALAPMPGQLLWDVGAGAGSVGIEWARAACGDAGGSAHSGAAACRVTAVERNARRAGVIRRNAARLGVPDLVTVVEGSAPEALAGPDVPDAIFVGGGGARPGVLEACWGALPDGGRLVAHAVTMETEAVLHRWYSRFGGGLTRVEVSAAGPIGTFTGWEPARPVVQWCVVKTR